MTLEINHKTGEIWPEDLRYVAKWGRFSLSYNVVFQMLFPMCGPYRTRFMENEDSKQTINYTGGQFVDAYI